MCPAGGVNVMAELSSSQHHAAACKVLPSKHHTATHGYSARQSTQAISGECYTLPSLHILML